MQNPTQDVSPGEPSGLQVGPHVLSPDREQVITNLLSKLESGALTESEQIQLSEALPQSGGQIMVQMAMQSESYSGSVPHPDLMNRYDPDTRKALLQMALDDQKHVHEMQRTGLGGAINKDKRGQWMGFGIAIAGLGAAALVAPFAPVVAGVIATIDIVGMVSVFVIPRAFERFGPPRKSASSQDEDFD